MSKYLDITGQKFGRLLALKRIGYFEHCGSLWEFKCDCGTISRVTLSHVKSGRTRSCGCYQSESIIKRKTTHGMTHTREYETWCNMKRRCSPKAQKSPNGQRYKGIRYCKRWKKFKNFIKYMGPIPKNKTSIDRIDGTKGYSKSNCRWADWSEQMRNRSCSRFIAYKGVTKHLTEWCMVLGMNYHTLRHRLVEFNWSVEKAFETPIGRWTR